jgi:hypothetical protein
LKIHKSTTYSIFILSSLIFNGLQKELPRDTIKSSGQTSHVKSSGQTSHVNSWSTAILRKKVAREDFIIFSRRGNFESYIFQEGFTNKNSYAFLICQSFRHSSNNERSYDTQIFSLYVTLNYSTARFYIHVNIFLSYCFIEVLFPKKLNATVPIKIFNVRRTGQHQDLFDSG